MSKTAQEILESENFQTFLKNAKVVVEFFERENYGKFEDFIYEARVVLLTFYCEAIKLEEIKYDDDLVDIPEFQYNKGEEGKSVNQKSRIVLGDNQYYKDTFDPIEEEYQHISGGWLVDDFEDIYTDIKKNILMLETNEPAHVEDAIQDFKWSFLHHTGKHCIDAIRALHFWIEKIDRQRELDAIVPFEPDEVE